MGRADPTPRTLETVDEIDAAWLTAALRQGGRAQAQVDKFRVEMDGARDAPSAVICKFRPLDPESHRHGVASRAYSCEAGAYRFLSGGAGGCRIPRLLWLDGDENNINLVIEDLTHSTRRATRSAAAAWTMRRR